MARTPGGRERELAAAAELNGRSAGRVASLMLEGEPRNGKTTLLHAAAEHARTNGYRVLSCHPVETESGLPFVSLGDLLEPALGGALASLPSTQRRALETALARVDPTETFGRLAVSRATLGV